VNSYAGYANADDTKARANLFYWFFESQKFSVEFPGNKEEISKTPLIIWLNGGPGAPSTLGLFLENGPYRMTDDSTGVLIENEYSWNKNAHMLFWDQPFGTGYSYASNSENNKSDENYEYVNNEDELSEMFYNALQNFFVKHPEYNECPIYITGESYAGKYVPNIAWKIHNKNKENSDIKKRINLKGIAVGDGWINARLQIKVYIDYAFTLGYIDIKQKDNFYKYYEQFCLALNNENWDEAKEISDNIVTGVSVLGGNFNPYDIRSFSDISMDNVQSYMEMSEVKKALNMQIDQEWNCADDQGPVSEHLIKDNMIDSSDIYSKIIKLNDLYDVLMYTGTFDTACGSLSTEKILYDLKKWNSSDDKIWKEIDRVIWAQPQTNVKGFIKQYKNLTQIVIPNSGHQVPYFKPEISRDMIYTWINKENFPSYSPIAVTKKDKTIQ